MSFRRRGETVVWRSLPEGKVATVIPMTVVADTADVTVLFQHPGVIVKKRAGRRGGPGGRLLLDDWDGSHEDRVWQGQPTLRLHVWGTSYAVIRSWSFDEDHAIGWYVNLESPWRRTAIGFDSQDLVLDVTTTDDLSAWSWKDDDELDWYVRAGRFTDQDAESIRNAGLEAIQALETRAWPFVEDWSEWRPDPNWPTPDVGAERWADP